MRVEHIKAHLGDELDLDGIEINEKSEEGEIFAIFDEKERVLYVIWIRSKKKGYMHKTLCRICKEFDVAFVEFVAVINQALIALIAKNDPDATIRIFHNGPVDHAVNIRTTWKCD